MIVELVSVSRAKYVYGKRYDIRRSHTFKKEFANTNELMDFLMKNVSVCIGNRTIKEMRKNNSWGNFVHKYGYIIVNNPTVYKKITGKNPPENT